MFAPAVVGPNFKNTWPKLYKRHNILFLLDESPKYNKLETIEKAVSLIRSYGGRIVMVAQSLTMLERIYGKDSDLFSNCGIKLFLAVADLDEAKKITEYAGKSTIHYMSGSSSRGFGAMVANSFSKNVQTQGRNLIEPDEVMRLSSIENRDMAILLVQGISPLKIERAYYFDYPHLVAASNVKFEGKIVSEAREFIWHRIDRVLPEEEGEDEDEDMDPDPLGDMQDRARSLQEQLHRRQGFPHPTEEDADGAPRPRFPRQRPGAPRGYDPVKDNPLTSGQPMRPPLRKPTDDDDHFPFLDDKPAESDEDKPKAPGLPDKTSTEDDDDLEAPPDLAKTISQAASLLEGSGSLPAEAEKVPLPKKPVGAASPTPLFGGDEWRPSKENPINVGEVVKKPGKNPRRGKYSDLLAKGGKTGAKVGGRKKVAAASSNQPALDLFEGESAGVNLLGSLFSAMDESESGDNNDKS